MTRSSKGIRRWAVVGAMVVGVAASTAAIAPAATAAPYCGIYWGSLPKTAEIQVDAKLHPEVTDVEYERRINRYDPNYVYDHPPIDPDQPTKLVYPVRLDDADALQLVAGTQINALHAQIVDLTAQLKALQGDAPAQTIAALQAKIAQVAALAEQAVTLLKA